MFKIREDLIAACISIQRALLGEISASLRAVVFSIHGIHLEVRFYFNGAISNDDFESVSCVETEIIADYDSNTQITTKCIRLDSPGLIGDNGVWVYQRRE